METLYHQGLNLVVAMLRGLENRPDFRVDTSTLQRIALLANLPMETSMIEQARVAETSQLDEVVSRDALARIPVQTRTQEPGAQRRLFEELRSKVLVCTKCPNLVAFRHSVVFGIGNQRAELMFVGEAPGADEDRQG